MLDYYQQVYLSYEVKMKVKIEYDGELKNDEVILRVSANNENVKNIVNALTSQSANHINGKMNEKIYLLEIEDVDCFYSYDNNVMFLANGLEYRTNEKLFELEMKYESKNFIRISKSVILNIKKVEYLAPEFNRKLMFKLECGRVEYSSRSYYTKIKEKLGV